jgi:uncharacterized protein (DUF58 family)
METTEILKKVRKIEIKTRGLSRQIFSGQYHSAFKGKGMAFSEVREYQYGDDIRNIDWNVTARFNHPFIKIFEEERELTVMLVIDVSGSNTFGTLSKLKEEQMTEIAAVLAFSAINNNDKVGVIFFSDKIEKFIPPKKGSTHILRIIRELIDFKAESHRTDISVALQYLTNAIKKRCTVFVISDFMDQGFETAIRIAGNKHDLVALRIYDQRETELINVGMVKMSDNETGEQVWVDTARKSIREAYRNWWLDADRQVTTLFNKTGTDFTNIATNQDYVRPLIKLFKLREARK